jgi:hypothetical protein
MTPRQTIGYMIVNEPLVQLAMLAVGAGLIWWTMRSLRSELDTHGNELDDPRLFHRRNRILAKQLKILLSSTMLSVLGFLLLLLPAQLAFALFTFIVIFAVVPLLIYVLIFGAPDFVWQLLVRKDKA